MKVLITGASQGIGRGLAERLARPGMELALCAGRPSDRLDDVVGAVERLGARALPLTGDLADPETPCRLVDAAIATFDGLDVLVANAAVGGHGALEDVTVDDWDRVFAVNVRAAWLLSRAAVAALRQSRGCIVMVSSMSGSAPHPGTGPYSSAKAALDMLVRHLALELAPSGVRVNAVSPGYTVTPRTAPVYSSGSPGVRRVAAVPLGRLAEPAADIAGVAEFLLSDAAQYVTGQNIVADGGVLQSVFLRDPMARR